MKNGFTLAEVLITLGIIGIVAAMTMPTLVQNHQKRSLEVATQKFYSMMSQAVEQYMVDEGVDDLRNSAIHCSVEDCEHAQEASNDFIKKYFKVIKECGKDGGCFAEKYIMQNGDEFDQQIEKYYIQWSEKSKAFITNDGMSILLHLQSDWPLLVHVDVNGKKGPNKWGYDLWDMDIFYDGSIDVGSINPECRKGIVSPDSGYLCGGRGETPSEVREFAFENCREGGYGGCFGHFLENNFKFDY